jgi:hypothetical protein
MTGEEALKACQLAANSSTADISDSLYTVATYGVWTEPLYPSIPQPYVTLTTTTSGITAVPSRRSIEELQNLKTIILEWISGLREYPAPMLAPIIGDLIEEIDDEKNYALLEKVVVRTLSWVLRQVGEDIELEE